MQALFSIPRAVLTIISGIPNFIEFVGAALWQYGGLNRKWKCEFLKYSYIPWCQKLNNK
jgi:hypothetical protein